VGSAHPTSLSYNRSRFYDPVAGRFLSEDPRGLAGGDTNLYRYAGNAPDTTSSPAGSGSEENCLSIFAEAFAENYSYYLNPLHNDPGEGWLFGTGKVVGWGMFVAGSAGAGILTGGGALVEVAGMSEAAAYTIATLGAVAGGSASAMQTYGANPNAGLHEYAFGVGLGAGFGGYMPYGGALELGGTFIGGSAQWAFGGDFYGQGMQWGGLAGSIAGGGLHGGWRAVAWQTGGAAAGAGIGYSVYGTSQGALLGANLGAMGGGIGRGVYGALGTQNGHTGKLAPVNRPFGRDFIPIQELEASAARLSASAGETPRWLANMDKGNLFNRVRWPKYPYNELYVQAPDGKGYLILDSYNPHLGEIVFRRFTQLSEISPEAAKAYLREAASYKPGLRIADVPSSRDLAGQTLRGQQIFEVPVQMKRVPRTVLDAAAKRKIIIRDVNNRVY